MLTPLNIQKIELSVAYTAVYLGTKERLFVIYLQPHAGKLLQQLVAKAPLERPTSFDIILSLITANDLVPQHILIDDEKEGVFFTKIFLEKKHPTLTEILEIDARPSDSLAMAIHYQVPILMNVSLLNKLHNLATPCS